MRENTCFAGAAAGFAMCVMMCVNDGSSPGAAGV
jgi:hypothetical protein